MINSEHPEKYRIPEIFKDRYLCKTRDQEVVEYALSHNISPALVAEDETRLPDKGLLQKMLHEWSCQMDNKMDTD